MEKVLSPSSTPTNKLAEQSFPIEGMTCASCVASVESLLRHQEGVENVSVNLASKKAYIQYDPNQTAPGELSKALRKIGFDLVLEDSSGGEADKPRRALRLKTGVALLLSLPVWVMAMFFTNWYLTPGLSLVLTAFILSFAGRDFFVKAAKQALKGQASMDTLVALSTGIAFLFSVFNTIFPEVWIGRGLRAPIYYESAALIISFILLGRYLEEKAKERSRTAIHDLMDLSVSSVRVIRNGREEDIAPEDLQPYDRLIIRPAERISVDGRVIDGISSVDESAISGEPLPVNKSKGDEVYAGTLNQRGSLKILVEKRGSETLLGQVAQAVERAQGSKAPVQKLVDRIASIFVPIVLGIALFTFAIWMVWGGSTYLSEALLCTINVLIIACPCALGLATPMAIMAGIGRGAELGILIKDAEQLQKAARVDTVVSDKTGTLTQGKPQVKEVIWAGHLVDQDVMGGIIAAIEAKSEHPLAQALYAHFREIQNLPSVEEVETIPGKGVRARCEGKTYYLGSEAWIKENKLSLSEKLAEKTAHRAKEAYSQVFFANEEEVLASIALGDSLRPEASEAVAALKEMGLSLHLLTGDQAGAAQAVAQELGIGHVKARCLPRDKQLYVSDLQEKGHRVMMLGDGINDAEALALAGVSVAMGQGTDMALEVAGLSLLRSDLRVLPSAIQLSKATLRNIRQNLFWAFFYNVLAIPMAAGLLYPFYGFLLSPMIAGGAMALSSLTVVLNSLRLRKFGP